MSVEALTVVLHHSRMTGTRRLVMIGIANHDGDGGAWPSIATLAKYASVTVRNAQKAVHACAEAGEIAIDERGGGDRRTPEHERPNLYRILVRCPAGCSGYPKHRPLSVPTPPVGSDGGPLSVATGAPLSVPTGDPLSVATPERSLNHPGNHPVRPARAARAGAAGGADPINAERRTAQDLIGEWIEACRHRPPAAVIGQVGKGVRAMLDEGIDPAAVRAGLIAWHERRLHPSALPSLVHEVLEGGPAPRRDARADVLDRGARVAAAATAHQAATGAPVTVWDLHAAQVAQNAAQGPAPAPRLEIGQ